MKISIALSAIAVLFAFAVPAHASTVIDPFINPIVTALDSTVNDPVSIDISYGTNLNLPDLAGWTVTIESVDVDFGDSGGTTTNYIWTGDPLHITPEHVYGVGGMSYSVTAFLNGYFTDPSNDQHPFFGAGGGTSVFIAGFSTTPIPPSLLLFMTALGGLGYLGARRRKLAPAAA